MVNLFLRELGEVNAVTVARPIAETSRPAL